MNRGVKVGATVALVLPIGPQLIVALAAALYLGLCVSLLEPIGPLALAKRLESLEPQHIVFDPDDPPKLGDFATLELPLVDESVQNAVAVSVFGGDEIFGGQPFSAGLVLRSPGTSGQASS